VGAKCPAITEQITLNLSYTDCMMKKGLKDVDVGCWTETSGYSNNELKVG